MSFKWALLLNQYIHEILDNRGFADRESLGLCLGYKECLTKCFAKMRKEL